MTWGVKMGLVDFCKSRRTPSTVTGFPWFSASTQGSTRHHSIPPYIYVYVTTAPSGVIICGSIYLQGQGQDRTLRYRSIFCFSLVFTRNPTDLPRLTNLTNGIAFKAVGFFSVYTLPVIYRVSRISRRVMADVVVTLYASFFAFSSSFLCFAFVI